jgi:hypothetical protein
MDNGEALARALESAQRWLNADDIGGSGHEPNVGTTAAHMVNKMICAHERTVPALARNPVSETD